MIMAFNGDPRKRPAAKSPERDASILEKRAPVAPMAPSKQDININTALNDFMNTSIALAKLDLKLDAAKEVLAAKTREYNNLLPQFAAFPAIKEEKTRAKAMAEEVVTNLETRMRQERTGSQHVIATLGNVISSQATATPAKSYQETSASTATASGETDLSGLTARFDALLEEVHDTQDETFETIEKILNETLEKKEQEIATGMNALRTQLKALNDTLEAKAKINATEFATLRTHITDSDKVQYQNAEAINDCVKRLGTVEAEVKDKINATEFATLRTHITDSDKVQYQNAEAINDCLKRLGTVEAAAEKASTAEGLATVEANVTTLDERIKKLETKKSKSANNGEVARMLKFQPVVYSESEDSLDSEAEREQNKSANPKGMQLVKGEIERLKFKIRQHETLFNNLTTDEVVKQMGDVYSNLYPQARNFEDTANYLKSQLAHVGTNLASKIDALLLRVDTHDKAVSDGKNSMTKLSGDIQQVSETIKQLLSRINKMDQ
ncbi:hypothetical protein AC578_11046 [Pseudocercospora eumusae]|uniref:Uncharacterized protein n=1 Tax=Pseudocercospora eumusae TaxID=321146 RepID=A0A139HS40_9PEZI|nr:hypothetical protein AC578_11046 [Pseudocercospora eumusae]